MQQSNAAEAVPAAKLHGESSGEAHEWGAATFFVSALLFSSLDLARRVLALVVPADFADPRARLVVQLARTAVAAGRPPTPDAILAYGNESGETASAHRNHSLMRYLHEPFAAGAVAYALPYLAADVLRERDREAFRELAAQLAELAESGSMDELRAAHDSWTADAEDRAARRAALLRL